jgi:hypothetical protein
MLTIFDLQNILDDRLKALPTHEYNDKNNKKMILNLI